ncbi:MAG: radical SAM protein [Paludibacteraceae bacterium]|nr:radical SAM protein [Paludibacteraceae bacterium]
MVFKIVTLGCKLNFAESSALGKVLLDRGHRRAKPGEEADLCIVNTCSVTDTADHKDRQAIHRIKRENPHARVIVTGCYARLKPDEIARMAEVDHVVPKREDVFQHAWSKDDRTRCFLKVQDGCDYFCTYCTIPFARGRSRNPRIKEVVAQAREALASGAKEIVLTGVNIGDFGKSTGETFIDLLRALDGLEDAVRPDGLPAYRVRISSCEPNLLSDEVIDFVAASRHFAPHFHIPLQSGSNEVLRIMHRRYTRELFKERVEHILSVMPNAFIGVDCMVGVRGETNAYWEDYLRFISALPVAQLHVFTYSERANTRMLKMDLEVIPTRERERRSKLLHAVSQMKTEAFYQAHRGEEAVVLWESSQKKVDGQRLMYGFTENYIKVSAPYDKLKTNTFEKIIL